MRPREPSVVCGFAERSGTRSVDGDAAKIRASEDRQQKHDRRDAALLLRLLCEKRFPRIWTPSSEERDARQLLIHRHKLVRLRAQVKNGLQHLAMNRGMQKKRRLWSAAGQQALRELALPPWASRRREKIWLSVLGLLDQQIESWTRAVQKAAEQNENARLLMTQPGVGPVTSLAFVLTMGDVSRFPRGKQVASYLGLDSAGIQFGRKVAARLHQQGEIRF